MILTSTIDKAPSGEGLILRPCKACGRTRPVSDPRDHYAICTECSDLRAEITQMLPVDSQPVHFKRVLSYTQYGCRNCAGLGIRIKGRGNSAECVLCECTLRSAFDGLLAAYHSALVSAGSRGEITVRYARAGLAYSRRNQEFVADVEILARRITRYLDGSYVTFPYHELIWRYFFQHGYDWKFCARLAGLPLDGATKFRMFDGVNRVKEFIAREACSLKPYALFPVNGY